MAAELVGGALLSSFVSVVFDRLSSPEVVNWIRGKKLDQRLLQKLETSLCVVQAVLNDAERKQIIDPAVKKWLTNLEDAVYVADDLLDEVHTKVATQKNPGNLWSRYFKFNLQARKMAAKIEEVIDTIEDIAKHKDILCLENISTENMSWRIPSTSLAEKSDIYGRDGDKEAIIKLLLDDTSDAKISVIPICGMGGIGKTTLAQLVYNDDKVKGKFDFKAWVCIGENFDVVRMTKTILEAKTSCSCNINDLDSIQGKLKDMLTGKRFLVVLDDIWNDNYDDWKIFQNPFQHGSEGSRIIVTSRHDKVASVVQTVPTYKLSLLSDEHCWLVFTKHASLSPESQDYSSLEKIGRKIVEKCKGLPLAAQTLGGLLRTKDNIREWNEILKSEIWEFSENESRILPALRISYHYLPSYLKRCFVFCSLYPKDYEIDRDELVLMWIAEDLLPSPKKGHTLEEIGYKSFNDLASRSFFQPSNYGENIFVMHDLMHDLATFYAGKFYLKASELGTAANVDHNTRHLSCDVGDRHPVLKFVEACDHLKHARTFVQTFFDMFNHFPEEIASSISLLLSQLKCLRVLSIVRFPLDSLPNSIGELIHLRYLDLSNALIMTLPESLSNLYNLQTLKLRKCGRLKILPSRMQDLVNLRHLDVRETSLEEMPKGMDKLKDLQFLSDYIVRRPDENAIGELGALANLHGSLAIHKLENVINSGDTLEARMIDKVHIDDLEFNWSSHGNIVDFKTEKDILCNLQPCTELKKLKIRGYMGKIFADWLGHSSYHTMIKLTLSGCRNCCKLPSLGQLPSLKKLYISGFAQLLSIGAEFYKNDEFCEQTPFPCLETLELIELCNWQVWHSSHFDDAFPQLKKLSISACPMLSRDLPNHLPALEDLHISGSQQLICSFPCAPNILKLTIDCVKELRFQELPISLCSESSSGSKYMEFGFEATTHTQLTCLQSLSISSCSSAISFPGACMPASLRDLVIRDCEKLEFPMQQQQQESLQSLRIHNSCDSLTSFPLAAFPNLTELEIDGCVNMECLEVSQSKDVAALPSLLYLRVKSCRHFVSLLSQSSRNAAFPSLRDLRIESCPRFASFLFQSSWNNVALPSLHQLTILECGSFVSFSTLGKVAPQLARLSIYDCPEIDSFVEEEGDGISLPPALGYLRVMRCEKLVRSLSSSVLHSCSLSYLSIISGVRDSVKAFPREGCLPTSLEYMHLWDFPSLETLDCKGLFHLTSLQFLSIRDCPNLENIVGEGLPASLACLDIHACPLLAQRCEGRDPQIWPKISDIPTIKVDGRCISDPRSSTDTEDRKGQNICGKGYFKCLGI